MTSFLNEVAAELVSRGISEPTSEQIADAMVGRINRQGELYERIFGCSYRGQVANGTREFVDALGESVYRQIRETKDETLVEFEGYFRSEQFVANALGLRKALSDLEK